MKYQAAAQQLRPNKWEVKSEDEHGDIEHLIFLGPEAGKQASEYAEWRNRLN